MSSTWYFLFLHLILTIRFCSVVLANVYVNEAGVVLVVSEISGTQEDHTGGWNKAPTISVRASLWLTP